LQSKTSLGVQPGGDCGLTDNHLFAPAQPRPQEKTLAVRLHLQQLGIIGAQCCADYTDGFIEQLVERLDL
jgi:hypothetical protein